MNFYYMNYTKVVNYHQYLGLFICICWLF